jgi:hypothetical protein
MCFIRQCSENLLAMLVDDAHVSSTQAFHPERKARFRAYKQGSFRAYKQGSFRAYTQGISGLQYSTSATVAIPIIAL